MRLVAMPSYCSCSQNKDNLTQCLRRNEKTQYCKHLLQSTVGNLGHIPGFVISVKQACRSLSHASSTNCSPPKISFLFNPDHVSDLASRVFPEKYPQWKMKAVVKGSGGNSQHAGGGGTATFHKLVS